MKTEIMSRVRTFLGDPRRRMLAGAGAVVLVAIAATLAFVLTRDGGTSYPSDVEPEGFSVSPQGEDVNRLSPIKVTFKTAPGERDPEKVLKVDPPTEGQYVWVSERTLLFQPDFPGLLRGQEYAVTVSAQSDAGLDEPVVHRFTTTGVLTVQAVIPAPNDVEVPREGQIMVQFSRSVAPLTLLSEASSKPVIEFNPPLPGKGEWLNTSLYRFIPESLTGNTKYEARIAAGLTSAADGVLKDDYTWTFNTYSPALVSVSPEDKTKFASLQQKVVLAFNQPMDTAMVESKVRVTGPNNTPVPGTFSWNAERSTLTFTPAGALLYRTSYTIEVPAGLKGAGGGETRTGRSTTFQTAGIPAVASTDPPNGATSANRYGIQILFTNPMDAESLEGKVSISGVDPAKIRADMYGDQLTLWVNAQLLPSTSYTVSIAAGAKDRYGQALAPYSFSFTTGPRSPFTVLAVPGQVGNYSASNEPMLYFHATNTASASFKLYRLTATEMENILSQNGIPQLPNRLWTPSSDPIRTWTQAVSGKKDEVVVVSTSLSGGGPLAKGDYFVRMDEGGWSNDLAFSVVDTAIVTKLSNDEFLAWVLDLDSGRVLPGVKVRAFGQGLGAGTDMVTDASGLASFTVPNPAGAWPPTNRSYYARVDDSGRKGVASTRWQNGTDPYQAGIQTEWYTRLYIGHIYTERPIYRPGEEVFYKAVVRTDDDARYSIPEGDLPVYVVIMDAQGKELLREKVQLNEFGTMGGSLRLPDGAAIGEYSAFLAVVRPDDPDRRYSEHVAGTSFAVAEFRKPEFQVEVATDRQSYASGDSIEAKVTATYFFGGGLEGAALEWSVLGVPHFMRVKGYEQFSFSDYDYYRTSVVREGVRAQGKGVTGADGSATFSVPAELKGDEGAMQFTVSATVTDQTAQVVASSMNVTVHPASGYAGIKPAEYLGETGRESRVDLVTADTEGKVIPNQKVTVKVYERTWVTTKEQTIEGARRYRSEPVDKLVETLSTTTDGKGEGSVVYTPKSSGTLRLVAELTDSQGRTSRTAAYLWVWGGGLASWRVTNDDTLQLIADRESYEVGDTAEILVPAPFTDAIGLVTVERGKVISRSTRTFPTNNERLSIPITDGSVPNVFVTVVLYRRPTITDPIPRYKVGYVRLPVSTKTRELNVTIQPDRQQAKPGEKVKYDIRVTDSSGKGVKAELSVAVVDKAVLSLTEERGTNGMKAFWFERGLGVATASSLSVSIDRSNDVISEPRLGGKGGGGFDEERVRQDFRNTAYWEAQVTTKDDGTATVEVTMPDNLTTWRMQARAVSGGTMVGEGTNELLSTQPLLLRPALPRFLRVGDRTTIRLLVRNATQKETEVKVSLDADGIGVSGDMSRSGKVAAGASTLFEWPATVSTEGTAKLTFRATAGGGLSDAVVQELPVALDVTPETTATGGIVLSEPMYEAIFLPKWAILKNGSLEVSVQPSLTGSMGGELSEFMRRPWEDVEGTVKIASRVIATIGVRRADKSAGASVETLDGPVKDDLASLISRQNPDGGWSWCWGSSRCESDPEVTGLVLLALGEARSEEFSIDGPTLGGANGWVSAYLSRLVDVANPADINQKAYLLYAMAKAGQGEFFLPQMRAMVEQHREKLANFGRGYLLLGMAAAGQAKQDSHMSQLLNDLATKVIPSANGNHWEDDAYVGTTHTGTRTTAVVLDALVRVDPGHPLIEETVRWLMVARGANHWTTLVERAQAVMALSEFAVETGELAGDYSYSARVNERELFSGSFKPGDGRKSDSKTIPLDDLGAGKVSIVGLLKDLASPGRMYYTMNLRYVTPAQGVEALNRGIAVTHEYSTLDAPGTSITRAKLGTVIRVKVTVMAPSELRYVTVEDLLPAGFEPIDTSLKIIDPKLKAQLEAERSALNRPEGIDYWAPWFRWYYSPWEQSEIRDDRVTLNATRLPKGVHEYVYYVRATSVGDYFVAPAHAEESFFPEVFGRSDSGRFVIEP